ncbi:MAG: 7-cyano-7-deazaguanine synthase QueC [Verrucomicrobiota bacterium]|nr:7-cyano-7-deazaguanine synthase QueC [Verrucomicrobiota bacterium]
MQVVHLLSGGLDSTVLAAHLLAEGHGVRSLAIDYGQRHRRELDAARAIADHYHLEHRQADLTAVTDLLAGSSLTTAGMAVPDGHYADESMKLTVVPNRNMLFLSLAICWAVSTKSDAVAYAAHAGDHTIYPDCRPEFAASMADAARLCDWHPVALLRPFVNLTKSAIVRRGHELGVPLHLTWSCYKGGAHHCGKCGTCMERREAFALAGVEDPTCYSE